MRPDPCPDEWNRLQRGSPLYQWIVSPFKPIITPVTTGLQRCRKFRAIGAPWSRTKLWIWHTGNVHLPTWTRRRIEHPILSMALNTELHILHRMLCKSIKVIYFFCNWIRTQPRLPESWDQSGSWDAQGGVSTYERKCPDADTYVPEITTSVSSLNDHLLSSCRSICEPANIRTVRKDKCIWVRANGDVRKLIALTAPGCLGATANPYSGKPIWEIIVDGPGGLQPQFRCQSQLS